MTGTRASLLIGAALTMLMAAGCRKADEPPVENRTIEQPAQAQAAEPEAEPAPVTAEPVAPANVDVAEPKPAPEPSADQQVLDDADATGMTARVSRGGAEDEPATSGNSQ